MRDYEMNIPQKGQLFTELKQEDIVLSNLAS